MRGGEVDGSPVGGPVPQVSPTLREAYAECERVTREQARNFSWGIRLLPPAKRAALSAVYAFARRADDIGDGDLPPEAKLAGLAAVRASVAQAGPGSSDPVLVALGDAARRFPLPLEAFGELVDGIEMDLRGTTYATFDELVGYCRCVAGSIGRLSLAVFGSSDPARAPGLADRLGIALQQTNILRDVREDLLAGRVYLPKEDLAAHGVTLALDDAGRVEGPRNAVAGLVRAAAERAETWYADGLRLHDLLDRRSRACSGAMAGIYHRLNAVIAAEPAAVLDRRVSLPERAKAAVALRSLAGGRP